MYTSSHVSAVAAFALSTVVTASGALAAQAAPPADLDAPIRSVALFKNGIAVVRRAAELPTPGVYTIGDVPDAVHGTLWVDAAGAVDVRATTRSIEVPTDGRWDRDPARELAGRKVRVRLRGEPLTEVSGRVVAFEDAPQERAWSRAFEQQRYWYGWANRYDMNMAGASQPDRYLALETASGRTFVDLSLVAFLEVVDAPETRMVKRPALEVTAHEGAGRLALSYLAKGLSYAPSYRLDIASPDLLELSQTAVIRNELTDLVGVEIELISGFPSMEHSHVLSPMSTATTWADFFAQLSSMFDNTRGNRVVVAQNASSNSVSYGSGGSAIQPASEGIDLHYHSIGTRDLREGDSLFVRVASERAPYSRIVAWRVPDTRDEWGRRVERQSWEPAPPEDQEGAWDALRFSNPFDFPMTTAPVIIVAGERFLGQRTTTWVNPGEETTVHVTKALAVRTTASEYEADTEREHIAVGGNDYRKVRVNGELQLCNHRQEAVQVEARREISGELIEASEAPTKKNLERGVYSVNRRQELVWSLTLAPGEERKVTFSYDVLVRE
ncbi:MAG: hypothetical protein R3F49_07570 [Planctomycetota bacterium]